MEKEEISFFKDKLSTLYQDVTDKLLEDKKIAESNIDKTKIGSVKITSRAMDIFKSIIKLGLKIIFMNKVSENVTESDFKNEVNDLVGAAKGENRKTDADNIRNENYIFQSESFKSLLDAFTRMKLSLNDDEAVEKFAEGLYQAVDICEWNKESDYIAAVMFIYKSGLIPKKEFARLCVVDDIHKEYQGILKKYELDVPVLSDMKNVLDEYENKFNKKYGDSYKQK